MKHRATPPRLLGLIILLLVTACGGAPVTPTTTATAPASTSPSGSAQPGTAAAATTGLPSMDDAEHLSVVYTRPGMDQIAVRRNLPYKSVAGPALAMDVYYPAGLPSNARRAAVLFVHGGPVPPGVSYKDTRPFVSWGQLVAASGLIGVTFNWRNFRGLVPQVTDIDDVIRHIRENAAALQIDRERLGLFAFSGGVAAVVNKTLQYGAPDGVRCLVAYYGDGGLGLSSLILKPPRTWDARATIPPLLIAHGAKDEFFPIETLERLVGRATAKGAKVELLKHPAGVHGFDVRNDDEQSREIIQKTIAFLQAQLTPK